MYYFVWTLHPYMLGVRLYLYSEMISVSFKEVKVVLYCISERIQILFASFPEYISIYLYWDNYPEYPSIYLYSDA